MIVREAVFALLRELNVTTIFGNPGSTELPMFRDLPADFRYVLGLQESVVVGLADGFAQATRNAALVNLHSSAGTGHALGNIYTAYRNQAPVVIIAGQQARSILPFEPFLYAERPTEFPRPFVKWASEPLRAADVPRSLARAYYEAMTPPCGPTFVSVPVDDWGAPCELVPTRRISTLNPGDPDAVAELAASLGAARRPALVLGAGAARDGAWDALVSLAERRSAAVFVAPYASRNVFPETHPLFAGFLPAFRERLTEMLSPYDVIVGLGGPLNLYHAEGSGPHLPPGSDCWLVSDNPATLCQAPLGAGILGNTREIVARLLDLLPTRGDAPSPRKLNPADLGDGLDDRRVMAALAKALPPGAIVVEEAPSSRSAMHAHLPFDRPDTFYTTASGGLGYAMPASVGIALGRPGERVVALVGDGSALYGTQAMFTAFQLDLPVTFVVVNNRSYQALRDFGREFAMHEVVGSDLSGLDFRALAQGHGIAKSYFVTELDQLGEVLAGAFSFDGPSLVEVRV